MRKKELEELEKINEDRKLNSEIKDIILKKVINNFLISFNIMLLYIALIIASRILSKETTILIYKISSGVLLVFTLFVFELAYKKNNDELAVHGIEMMFFAIITLLTPFIFIEKARITSLIVGCYFTGYYILKNIVVFYKEKNKYLIDKSDIPQIIKKESQDELAQEEKLKRQKEPPKRKRGRPRKDG